MPSPTNRHSGVTTDTCVEPQTKQRSAGASATPAASPVDPRDPEEVLAWTTIDLVAQARAGGMQPIVGRNAEIDRLIECLLVRTEHLVMLIGPAGAGRLAVVQGLAQRIAAGRVPELEGYRFGLVRPERVVGPDGLRPPDRIMGEYVARAAAAVGMTLVLHDLPTSSSYSRRHPLSDVVEPRAKCGELRAIATVTVDEKGLRSRAASRLGSVVVRPVAADDLETVTHASIAQSLGGRSRFARPDVARELVALATAHDRLESLPDLGVEVADMAAVRARGSRLTPTRRMALVRRTFGDLAGLAPDAGSVDQRRDRLNGLEARLNARVIGQEQVVRDIAARLTIGTLGFRVRPDRPVGALLLSGPTGVGKTELARALADEFGGGREALIQLDMSEFSTSHDVWKILSPPPGIVGHGRRSPLLGAVERRPHSVVLFDEIEKAHPAIHRLLLQILDEGHLTDSAGETVSFSKTVIVMTTNATSDAHRRVVGFNVPSSAHRRSVDSTARELAGAFAPELLSRLDAICAMRSLTVKDSRRILEEVMLPRWATRRPEIELTVSATALDELARRGHSETLGARRLEGVLEQEILSLAAVEHARTGAAEIAADFRNGEFSVRAR